MPDQLEFDFTPKKEKEDLTIFKPGENVEICPHCGRRCVTWKKSIISTAVRSLINLVYLSPDNRYVHLDDFILVKSDRGNGNFSQLKNWKLVWPRKNDDPKKRASGYYRPTEFGRNFVLHGAGINKYIVTRDNVLLGTLPPVVNVVEAGKLSFNYAVLMAENGFGSVMDALRTQMYEEDKL